MSVFFVGILVTVAFGAEAGHKPPQPLVNDLVGSEVQRDWWRADEQTHPLWEAMLTVAYLEELGKAGVSFDDAAPLTRLASSRERSLHENLLDTWLQRAEEGTNENDTVAVALALNNATAQVDNLKVYRDRLQHSGDPQQVREAEALTFSLENALKTIKEHEEEQEKQRRAQRLVLGMKLMVLVIGVASAAGAIVLAWRAASRRRHRRYRINPYVTGAPIRDAEGFIGRTHLVHQAMHLLVNYVPVYLQGERRIGKTSIIIQTEKAWQAEGRATHFISLEGLPPGALGQGLAEAIRAHGSAMGLSAETLAKPLGVSARSAQEKAGRLLLVLDEVDYLNRALDEELAVLRNLTLTRDAPCALLMAGVNLDLTRLRGAGLDREPTVVAVEPLPPADARRLLLEPARDLVLFEPAVVEEIVRRAHGRPMLIQLYGLRLVDHVGSQTVNDAVPWGLPTVTTGHLEAVENEVQAAWRSVQAVSTSDEDAPLDLDHALFEVARLEEEIHLLEHDQGMQP